MLFDQITIIGVGLIGGSIGLAAKARNLTNRVVGVGRDTTNLARAIELGAIDTASTDISEGVREAGLVLVCTPVGRIAETILRSAPHCRRGAIFTDGGSTKANIVSALTGKMPVGVGYVPAHPLAGSEKNGVEHARLDLFENRLTILTPTAATEAADVEQVSQFWQKIGSRVVQLSPDEHDRILAATSHLPHAVASTLAAVTPAELLPYSAGGFRDTTRIAGGNPSLWADIFEANQEALLAALAGFAQRVELLRTILQSGDRAGLVAWLTEAKQVRDALGT